MEAEPPSDVCERALTQYTALLFNVLSSRLQTSCVIQPIPDGCDSTDVGALVDELAGLIESRDAQACQVALDCAAAINDGRVVP